MRERGPECSLEPFTDLMSKIRGLRADHMCGPSVGRSCVVCFSVTLGAAFLGLVHTLVVVLEITSAGDGLPFNLVVYILAAA